MSRRLAVAFLSVAPLAACSSNTNNQPTTCTNISGAVTADGLNIRKPEEDAAACHEIDNATPGGNPMVCEKKAPDFSCVAKSEPFKTSIPVTYTGCVKAFGLSTQSNDLTVTILRELRPGGSIAIDPGYDLNGQPGMQAEKSPDAVIGKTISTMVPQAQCHDLGAYSIDAVPTETNLIVRVTDQHIPKDSRQYVDAYQYNIVLRNDLIRSGPNPDSPLVPAPDAFCALPGNHCYVVDDVNTIGVATFRTVSLAAGVSDVRGDNDLYDGDGQGHLAGQVQDCSSLDRVQNAVVALDGDYRKLAYFNVGFPPDTDNIEDPKVEGTRSRTNADGLYAAIAVDVPVGGKPVKVGAAVTPSVCGADGVCKCTADNMPNPMYTTADQGEGEAIVLGTRTVYVFPDSITILTFDRDAYVTR